MPSLVSIATGIAVAGGLLQTAAPPIGTMRYGSLRYEIRAVHCYKNSGEGLPHYAAYPPRRVEELLVDSENMRQLGDEWERFWFLDQPSHLTPFRTHGGLGP